MSCSNESLCNGKLRGIKVDTEKEEDDDDDQKTARLKEINHLLLLLLLLLSACRFLFCFISYYLYSFFRQMNLF